MRTSATRRWSMVVAAAACAVLLCRASSAQDVETDELRVEVLPYAWIPGTVGSIGVRDTTVRVDVGPDDVINMLFDGDALAAGGYAALSYGRFGLFVDSFGGYEEPKVSQTIPTALCCTLDVRATSRISFALTDVGIGWELLRRSLPARSRPLTLGVWAGTRVVYLSTEVDARAGVVQGVQRRANVSSSTDWADPLLGVRWSVPLLDAVALELRGDIGGFGASSDLTWGLVGDVRIWLPWRPFDLVPYSILGYRVVAFDRSPGEADVDLQLRGPIAGVGFAF